MVKYYIYLRANELSCLCRLEILNFLGTKTYLTLKSIIHALKLLNKRIFKSFIPINTHYNFVQLIFNPQEKHTPPNDQYSVLAHSLHLPSFMLAPWEVGERQLQLGLGHFCISYMYSIVHPKRKNGKTK